MGYRSKVRIAISKKGYKELCNYIEKFAERRNVNKDEIFELLEDTDINLENKYQKYFGWDWIKWYDSYPEIDAITEGLSYVEKKGYSYKFSRIGEDYTDIEEQGCEGDKDTKKLYVDYPYLYRDFDDLSMENQMKEQDQFIERLKNLKKLEQER